MHGINTLDGPPAVPRSRAVPQLCQRRPDGWKKLWWRGRRHARFHNWLAMVRSSAVASHQRHWLTIWTRAFLAQVPPVILSIVLVQWKLKVPQKSLNITPQQSARDKLLRIDFIGALLMSIAILTALFVLDTGGQKYAWKHPIVISSACIAIISAGAFCLFEKFCAKEPIFPIQLLTRYVVVTSYGILLLQNLSQTAVSGEMPARI